LGPLCDFFHEVFVTVDASERGFVMLFAEVATPIQTPAGLEPAFDLSTYYPIFIFLGFCLLVPIAAIIGSHTFNPKKKTPVKLMPYESGMDPIGSARHKFDVKFYLIAILFLVFDVELLFLYPWAVMAYADGNDNWRANFGRVAFWEILVFLATLAVAYVYAWRNGVFRWR
jgi:NADH:ubiquinone oxidoreductase subunit 3 (subunit A)